MISHLSPTLEVKYIFVEVNKIITYKLSLITHPSAFPLDPPSPLQHTLGRVTLPCVTAALLNNKLRKIVRIDFHSTVSTVTRQSAFGVRVRAHSYQGQNAVHTANMRATLFKSYIVV